MVFKNKGDDMDKISIVIPCYNEEEILEDFHKVLAGVMNSIQGITFEYCFIDDGSIDHTYTVLKKLKLKDDRVHIIRFSRNFGKEAAMYAGFSYANGDYIAILDADLQDPPEMIKEMYEILKEEDYDCVGARRVNRNGEPVIRSFFAMCFYKIMHNITGMNIVDGARDFRMMKRKMVQAILSVKEYNRFSKGIFTWVGFETKYLEYKNIERPKGKTKWSFWGLFKYSIEGIVSFSTMPLFLSALLGGSICLIAVLWLMYFLISNIVYGNSGNGFATLVCLILLLGGIMLFSVGILGIYIARIYLETKERPLYIIKDEI